MITARVNKEQYIKSYIRIWNGVFSLTKNEQSLLYILLREYIKMDEGNVAEPYRSQLLFNTANLREMREELGMSVQNFNNSKNALKKKKAIFPNGDSYTISPKLIPVKELVFKFIVDETK